MDLSEFKRRLAAEPGRMDAEMQAARRAGPEFEAAAAEAERLEALLRRALALPVPADLAAGLVADLPASPRARRGWLGWPAALAAGLLLALGATAVLMSQRPHWDSVEDYVVEHYRHDGARTVAMLGAAGAPPVERLLAEFRLSAEPALAGVIGVIKACPTPGGRGVHMVLDTQQGPVTVIYMPGTQVTDRALLAFDDVEAMLVDMPGGAAAIIGHGPARHYAMVHDALRPLAGGP